MKNYFVYLLVIWLTSTSYIFGQNLKPRINNSIETLLEKTENLNQSDKEYLIYLADQLVLAFPENSVLDIVFVDQDNASESQLAQVWLQTALTYYDVNGIRVYSAGLKKDQIDYEEMVKLEAWGFQVRRLNSSNPDNIVVKFGRGSWTLYSKVLDRTLGEMIDRIVVLDGTTSAKLAGDMNYSRKLITDNNEIQSLSLRSAEHEVIATKMLFLAKEIKSRI